MKRFMLQILALALGSALSILIACGGGGPSTPTPTPSGAPPPPAVNSFTLTADPSPPAGTVLVRGVHLMLTIQGTYTLENEDLWVGVVAVYENGEGHLTGVTKGYRSQARPCPYSGGLGLDPRTFTYDLLRGHVVDMWFIVGRQGMMGAGGVFVPSEVVYAFKVPTKYTTAEPAI